MNLTPLQIDLAIVGGEVLALLVIFVATNWIVRYVLRLLTGAAALARLRPGVEVLRQNLRLVLIIGCALACLGAIGVNGWWLYKGESVRARTLELVERIPPGFWNDLAVGAGKSVALVIVAFVVLRFVGRFLGFLCAKAKAFEGIKANDESIDDLFTVLRRVVRRATWLLVLAVSAQFLLLPASVPDTLHLLLKIYLFVAAGMLAWRSLDAVIASLDALSRKYSDSRNLMRYYDHLSPLVPALRRAVEYVIYVVVATLVLQEIAAVAPLADWGPRIIRIIGIVFLSRVIVEVVRLLIDEYLVRRAELTEMQRQRRLTIVPLLKSVAKYAIYFSAAIMVLKTVGFDPTPVLAGAGILGLAVGFGAQNLIADVVSGFFILFENYYLVGDFVKIGDAEGNVETIELTATRVRDRSGRLHIVRNGQIDDVVNYSKEYTFAVVEVGVAYESSLDDVVAALEEVGTRIQDEHEDVLAPTVVQGLDAFGESELLYRTITKVKPGKHRPVERRIRRLIKDIFDERDIEIPYARRLLLFKDADGDANDPLAPAAPAA